MGRRTYRCDDDTSDYGARGIKRAGIGDFCFNARKYVHDTYIIRDLKNRETRTIPYSFYMKKYTLLMLATLATSSLMAQDVQQIANTLVMPELKAGAKVLPMPKVSGASVKLLGADYQELILPNGQIAPVIAETPVNVSFKVTTANGKEAVSKDFQVMLKPTGTAQANVNPKPKVIPEILQWRGSYGFLTLSKKETFCCPKSLEATVLRDLKEVTGREFVSSDDDRGAGIVINVVNNKDTEHLGQEGYMLNINRKNIIIKAATTDGAFWATRTLLQLLRQNEQLPCGVAVDIPRYQVRGFMLDIARTPYPLSYLRDVVRTMAWYKMNDLHLVINNNYIFHENYVDANMDPFKESYAAFRLESKVKGKDGTPLTAKDLYYTKKEFVAFVKYAKKYHVNIVPEFDTPGHALSFTRVRPDLIYKGPMNHENSRCEMLDASNPETVKFVSEVLDEYLVKDSSNGLNQPVLGDCKVVHVGADEFHGDREGYRKFANGMLTHVAKRGYTPRIWGSLSKKPGKTPVMVKGVQMNLWSNDWMKPWEAVNLGYDVINTNDRALYIVPFANYYRMDHNHKGVYNNWTPNQVGGVVLPAGHPQLIGSAFAIWNDMIDLKHTGYAPYDIWGILSGSIDVLSQKMWGKAKAPMSFEQHRELVKSIGNAPNTNPLYKWENAKPIDVKPTSLPMALNKPALGPNYHVTMEVEMTAAPDGKEQVLLSAPEGKLFATMADGTIGFRRDDAMEFSFGAKLPVGKKVKLELIGAPEKTRLLLDGKEAGTMELKSFRNVDEQFRNRTKGLRSTFILPLTTLGESFNGKVHHLSIVPK